MMNGIEFKIDWLAITVWGTVQYAENIWNEYLAKYLGETVHIGHGGRGFKVIKKGLAEGKLYLEPVNEQGNYFHIELPAKACDAIPSNVLTDLFRELNWHEKTDGSEFRVTRLDLAWDGVNCSPQEFLRAVENDYIRTLSKRESTKVESSPMALKENGEMGTTTVSLGSRTSTRSIRVYDKRGYTRVELETRHERSDQIARILFSEIPQLWADEAMKHLRDYIDVFEDGKKEKLAPWWEELVTGIVRANLKVSDASELELVRIEKWFVHQVAPALSVLMDVVGEDVIETFVAYGRVKRGDRYNHILQNIEPQKKFKKVQGVLGL